MLKEIAMMYPGVLPHNPYTVHCHVRDMMDMPERRYQYCIDRDMSGVVIRSAEMPDRLARQARDIVVDDDEMMFSVATIPAIRNGERRLFFGFGDVAGRERWFARKARENGFEVIAGGLVSSKLVEFDRKGKRFKLDECVFGGRLRVVDRALFEAALREGIGRSRGFGYGMVRVF